MSLNLVQSAEHAYAAAAKEMVAIAKFVKSEVVPALKKVEAGAAVIEQITGLIDPAAENIERAAFAMLGMMLHVIDTAGELTNGAVNLEVGADLIAELRTIGAAIKGRISSAAGAAK
jgi:hypothetical protein